MRRKIFGMVCVARAGRDGCDGRSIILRVEYDRRDAYARLIVVTRAGCRVAT
jgi:hypothetical protein